MCFQIFGFQLTKYLRTKDLRFDNASYNCWRDDCEITKRYICEYMIEIQWYVLKEKAIDGGYSLICIEKNLISVAMFVAGGINRTSGHG